jgi:transposase
MPDRDNAYDSGVLRDFLEAENSFAVIPPKVSGHNSLAYGKTLYRQRNFIGRAFNCIKDWCAIATRYDKKATKLIAGVYLAAAHI